jgi:hypothetical protein
MLRGIAESALESVTLRSPRRRGRGGFLLGGERGYPSAIVQFVNQVACACGEVGKDKFQGEAEEAGEALELGVVGRNEGVERPAVELLEALPVIRAI